VQLGLLELLVLMEQTVQQVLRVAQAHKAMLAPRARKAFRAFKVIGVLLGHKAFKVMMDFKDTLALLEPLALLAQQESKVTLAQQVI
jgi:hypothetical protein